MTLLPLLLGAALASLCRLPPLPPIACLHAALPHPPPTLRQAMGSRLAPEEVEALFTQAGPSGDGTVDVDGLAAALTACHGDGEFDR